MDNKRKLCLRKKVVINNLLSNIHDKNVLVGHWISNNKYWVR